MLCCAVSCWRMRMKGRSIRSLPFLSASLSPSLWLFPPPPPHSVTLLLLRPVDRDTCLSLALSAEKHSLAPLTLVTISPG